MSLVGCSPKGSLGVGYDWATSPSLFTFMHWRRKWQPLQCSCLENPRDWGAWWAAVYGVAQSRTRLKRFSSSSSSCGWSPGCMQDMREKLPVGRFVDWDILIRYTQLRILKACPSQKSFICCSFFIISTYIALHLWETMLKVEDKIQYVDGRPNSGK